MSIVIAVKHDGMVSFVCDSQSTRGYLKTMGLNDGQMKIKTINGIVIGTVGHKIVNTLLQLQLESNPLPTEIPLTKEWIVKRIVNPFFNLLDQRNLLDVNSDKTKELESRALIAKGDALFSIHSDGAVVEIPNFACIGSGSDYAMPHMLNTSWEASQSTVKMQLFDFLRTIEQLEFSIGKPFIYINTNNLSIETESEV